MTKQERIATDLKRQAAIVKKWIRRIDAGKPIRGTARKNRRHGKGKTVSTQHSP